MKLAEAMLRKVELEKHIQQLRVRLNNNAIVQEGERPSEEPKALFVELNNSIAELQDISVRITKTNCNTNTEHGNLIELLEKKTCLTLKLEVYMGFVNEASSIPKRAISSEIKIQSTLSVGEYQKYIDQISKELRELDVIIQSTSWKTDLESESK